MANNLYSLQQAAGGAYNSLSLNANSAGVTGHQNHTLNYNARGGGTLIVTREDFNIEDIHCQMVYKVQRNNQLLREIEGIPGDKLEPTPSEMATTEDGRPPQLIEVVDAEEVICGDMCSKSAINWGRGKETEQAADISSSSNRTGNA